MPETSQYTFTHKEVVGALVKQAGLHEGKWTLLVQFAFGAANAGASDEQMIPTAFAGVQHIGLQRAGPDSPASMTVDASEVNPAPTKTKSKTK